MLSPAVTPPMIPVVARSASSSRALAVTGKPVIASCVAPITPIPARSITIPAVTTRDGLASISTPAAATAISVAAAAPAICW